MLVVLLGLLSVAVVHLTPLESRSGLPEGVQRFEAVLRQARAEAALRGRRVRVTWRTTPVGQMSTGRPASDSAEAPALLELAIESDPLARPGEFDPLRLPGLEHRELAEWIRLERFWGGETVAAGAETTAAGWGSSLDFAGETDAAEGRLVFDPEGRSAGVRWLVAAAEPSDPRLYLVELDGLTGRVRHRLLAPEESEEWLEGGGDSVPMTPGLPVFPTPPSGEAGEPR